MEIVLVVVFLVAYLILFTISIGMYLFNGFGLMEMAKRNNEKYPFLGFVPYANLYLTGKLAYNSKKGAIFYLVSQIVYVVIVYILYFVVYFVSAVSEIVLETNSDLLYIILGLMVLVLSMAYLVIYFITMYKLYKRYSKKPVLMLIFTILTGGILAPIFVFAIRKNEVIN